MLMLLVFGSHLSFEAKGRAGSSSARSIEEADPSLACVFLACACHMPFPWAAPALWLASAMWFPRMVKQCVASALCAEGENPHLCDNGLPCSPAFWFSKHLHLSTTPASPPSFRPPPFPATLIFAAVKLLSFPFGITLKRLKNK